MTTVATSQLTRQDIAALSGITERWVAACLNEAWDAIAEMCAEHVLLMPPDEPAVEGRAGLIEWYEAFPRIREFEAALVEAEGNEDFAYANGTFAFTVEPEPGQLVSSSGKWLASYCRAEDGTWQVTRDCWNLDAPAL